MANSPAGAADESLITPFTLEVPQADLEDLRARPARARWPATLPGEDWDLGVPAAYLRSLSGYWRDSYGWRREKARPNSGPVQCSSPPSPLEVVVQRGVVEILHAGVLTAIHAGRWALRSSPMNGRRRISSTARAHRLSP
jgi:hypothetical protein